MNGYQLKITIKGSKPPIWRRVIVPEKISFYQLHQTIQQAFGWYDCHLHEFEFPAARIRVVDPRDDEGDSMDLFDTWEIWSEKELIDHLLEEYPRFAYNYDFGDYWEHQILMEKVVEYPQRFPTVVKYKGDNLPEDCGGIWGYYEMLERLEKEPENEELRQWADCQEMKAFDMKSVNSIMETDLVFKPGKKRAKKKKSEPGRIGNPEELENSMRGVIARFESELARFQSMYSTDSLHEMYQQYDKDELKRLAKLHHLTGYSGMNKNALIQNLAEHIQKKEVMERYFRCASDVEIQVFEKAAAQAGTPYDQDEEDCQYLHFGGYYGLTDTGVVVVAPTVAQAYQAISTEKFHKARKRTYLVWAYMTAALYLYGVTTDEEIAAIFNLYESDILTIAELHSIFREVQGLRCDYKYKNGYFLETELEEDDSYHLVLKNREGKKAFIPSRELVMEIAELGLSEPRRQLGPWVDFIGSIDDTDPMTAFGAVTVIHHMIRLGCRPQDVMDMLQEAGILLETEEEMREFGEVLQNTWNRTRMISNYGFTPEELSPAALHSKMDGPCPCGSGKRYRQCCGRTKKE